MTRLSIHEVRRMMLPIETVVDAVLQLDRDSAGTLSYGAILDATIVSEPDAGLLLSVQLRGSQAVERRIFALPVIAAAIMNYCRQLRIPLPRNGTKTLEVVPEGFALSIQTTLHVPRLHNALQARSVRPARQVVSPDSPGSKIQAPRIGRSLASVHRLAAVK